MGNFIDLTGQKFGRLLVLERVENYIQPNGTIKARWKCLCECGKHCVVCSRELRYGKTKSCGCFKLEIFKTSRMTHGKTHTRLYGVWQKLKKRCYNPSDKYYKDYGGRGITVCQEWKNNFQVFYDDVSKLPHFGEEGYSLNRIDNDGNYELSNIEWATNIEQQNNKRNNHLIEYNGKTQTLTQWAMKYGLNFWTLKERLKRGWSIEKALTTPTKAK